MMINIRKNINICYESCPENTYISSENNYICLKKECPEDMPYENENNESIKECSAVDLFNGLCKIKNNNPEVKDNIISNIKEQLMGGGLDSILLNNNEGEKNDLVIQDDNNVYQITFTDNQDSNKNDNISIIKLGECENKLREFYNISEDEPLLIFKIDVYEEGLLVPIIEYEVYRFKTKNKLDLSVCNNIKIDILVPVSIEEKDNYKYNLSSEYYNDICYTYTTENGTDMTIKDRKNEFNNNNMSLCESKCEYDGYDSDIKKAKCKCEVKVKIPLMSEIVINKDKLLDKFTDIKSSLNLKILKCYKLLFSLEGIKTNIGNYIILIIIIITICSFFIFYFKEFNVICDLIKKIVPLKQKDINIEYNSNLKTQISGNNHKNKKSKRNKKSQKTIKINKINIINNNKDNKIQNDNRKKEKKKLNKEKQNIKEINKESFNQNPIIKKNNNNNISNENKNNPPPKDKYMAHSQKNKIDNIKTNEEESKILALPKLKLNKNKNKNQYLNNSSLNNNDLKINKHTIISNISKLNDFEINSLEYIQALKLDKRNYIQYYFSLLRVKHILILTFYTYNDYNSRVVKIVLFLFSFSLYFIVNALFFSDSTMHKIYEDQGAYNFIYQIPQILYSSLICSVINTLFISLSLSEKIILSLKRETKNIKEKIPQVIKCLKLKFLIFFPLVISLLLLFWYYISCFCAVYKNTQIHLIKDTLISFGLSLIYPIGLCLIPGIFRIPALKASNGNKECLYKFSKIIQLL